MSQKKEDILFFKVSTEFIFIINPIVSFNKKKKNLSTNKPINDNEFLDPTPSLNYMECRHWLVIFDVITRSSLKIQKQNKSMDLAIN